MTESPRRNILEMYRSLLTGLDFFFPFPLLGTSVHISFTFSSTMLQCLGGGAMTLVLGCPPRQDMAKGELCHPYGDTRGWGVREDQGTPEQAGPNNMGRDTQ